MKIKQVISAGMALSMLLSVPLSAAYVLNHETGIGTVTASNGAKITYSGTSRIASQDTSGGEITHYNSQGQPDYVTDSNGKVTQTNTYDSKTGQLLVQQNASDGQSPGSCLLFDPNSGNYIRVEDKVLTDGSSDLPQAINTMEKLNKYLEQNGGGSVSWENGIPKFSGTFSGHLKGISFSISGASAQKAGAAGLASLFGGDTAKAQAFIDAVGFSGSGSITLSNQGVEEKLGQQDKVTASGDASSDGNTGGGLTEADFVDVTGNIVAGTYTVSKQGITIDIVSPFRLPTATVKQDNPPSTGDNSTIDNTTGGTNNPNNPSYVGSNARNGSAALSTSGDNVIITGKMGAPMKVGGTWVVPVTGGVVDLGGGPINMGLSTIYVALPDQLNTGIAQGLNGQTATFIGRVTQNESGKMVISDTADTVGFANTSFVPGSAAGDGMQDKIIQNYINAVNSGKNMSTLQAGWSALLNS